MSTSCPCFMLTSSPYSLKKSAPIIGVRMSATTKIQRNTRLSPKSKVKDRLPKVAMEDPLTALRPEQSCLFFRSDGKGGMMLTSAPVSMRKRWPELKSVKNSRRLRVWPAALVAASDRPGSFPTSYKEVGTSWRRHQMSSGTSRGCCRHQRG